MAPRSGLLLELPNAEHAASPCLRSRLALGVRATLARARRPRGDGVQGAPTGPKTRHVTVPEPDSQISGAPETT